MSISCVFLLFIIRLYLGEVVLTGVCGLSGDGCSLVGMATNQHS